MDNMSLREWMDLHVSLCKQFIDNQDFSDSISMCSAYICSPEYRVHVFKGIEKLSEEVNEVLHHGYKEVYFTYHGVDFFEGRD